MVVRKAEEDPYCSRGITGAEDLDREDREGKHCLEVFEALPIRDDRCLLRGEHAEERRRICTRQILLLGLLRLRPLTRSGLGHPSPAVFLPRAARLLQSRSRMPNLVSYTATTAPDCVWACQRHGSESERLADSAAAGVSHQQPLLVRHFSAPSTTREHESIRGHASSSYGTPLTPRPVGPTWRSRWKAAALPKLSRYCASKFEMLSRADRCVAGGAKVRGGHSFQPRSRGLTVESFML